MTADVYSGDNDLRAGEPASLKQSYKIRIVADADANLLLQIAVQISSLNATPERLVFQKRPGDIVVVEIEVYNCTQKAIDLVCRKVDQITSVRESRQANMETMNPDG